MRESIGCRHYSAWGDSTGNCPGELEVEGGHRATPESRGSMRSFKHCRDGLDEVGCMQGICLNSCLITPALSAEFFAWVCGVGGGE